MTWTDPTTLSTFFDTTDIPTQGNFDSLFNDLLSLYHPLDTTPTDNNIVSSATEDPLYTVTVPANSMSTTGAVYMRMEGDYLFNNGAGDTLRLRVKFGGVTHIDSGAVVISTNIATRWPWTLDVWVRADGATNAQLITALLTYHRTGSGTAVTTGIGSFMAANVSGGLAQNTGTIDTTADQALLVTAQWSASSANNSWRRRWAQVLLGQN